MTSDFFLNRTFLYISSWRPVAVKVATPELAVLRNFHMPATCLCVVRSDDYVRKLIITTEAEKNVRSKSRIGQD